MAQHRSKMNTSGFTLIELLVVIATIAILASLLLPALSRGKDSAKRIACMNNQRQLYLGWAMYTYDHDGRIPGNHPYGGVPPDGLWVSGLMSYENDVSFNVLATDNTNTLLIIPGKFGSIGPYVGSVRVYRCPSDSSWALLGGVRYSRLRSYSMNNFVGFDWPDAQNGRHFFREEELNQAGSDRIYLFIDEHEDTISDNAFDFPMDTRFDSLPASRHGRGSVITYAGGRVAFQKWQDSRTVLPVQHKRRYSLDLPGSPDIEWFKWHSTVPK